MKLLLVFALVLAPLAAFAEKRVGLIIGNDMYDEVPMLAKAVADAKAIEAKLTASGFETVLAVDVTRREMNRAIARFTNMLEPGDTAMVFYAGHGVEISGENYLLPTDIIAPASGEQDVVASESIALSELLDRVRRTGARTTIAIIDACRDNPFEAATGRSLGRTRGLGRIAAPEGTFVMFSAGAGQLALDGLHGADPDENSVFTRLLLPKLEKPGLELRTMIAELRVEVRDLAKTQNHEQFPAYYDELLGDFYFKSARGLEPVNVATDDKGDARIRADFAFAREIGSPLAYEAFLKRYGDQDDFTVALAEQLLEDLRSKTDEPLQREIVKKPEQAASVKPKPETPAQPDPTVISRREIIRASQVELSRLGCNPGGADGQLGPRSRAAFGRFVTQTGSSLSQNELGSQSALDVLRSTAAPACKTVVAQAPAAQSDDNATRTAAAASTGLDISGTWSFSFFCIVVPGSGTAVVRRTGANTFRASFRDSLNQTGTFAITLDGRNYRTRITNQDGVVAHETGVYSADGRSYKATSHSVGCSVKGKKVG